MALCPRSHTKSTTYPPRRKLSDRRKNWHDRRVAGLASLRMRQSDPNFCEIEISKQVRWNKIGKRIVPNLEIRIRLSKLAPSRCQATQRRWQYRRHQRSGILP